MAFIVLLSFGVGYGFHDIVQKNGINPLLRTINIPDKQTSQSVLGQTSDNQFVTSVTYDGHVFHPDHVMVKKGNYIAITNKSPSELMWLTSNYDALSTKRGFGEGERLQVTLMQEGVYVIHNQLRPEAIINLTVEP